MISTFTNFSIDRSSRQTCSVKKVFLEISQNCFLFITWPHVTFLIVGQHFATFCGQRPCGSSDTAAKIVYMTL